LSSVLAIRDDLDPTLPSRIGGVRQIGRARSIVHHYDRTDLRQQRHKAGLEVRPGAERHDDGGD
jgi:hypothetical protein